MRSKEDEPRSRYRKYRRDRYARLTAEEKRKYIENVSRKKTLKSTGQNRTACIDTNGQCFTPIPVLDLCDSEFEVQRIRPCSFCGARKFQYETPNFCCYGGKVVLASPSVPEALHKLYTSQCQEGKEFHRNIRAYNSIFSFTSFGVKRDKGLATSQQGVYTFRAQGQVYHDLPSLIPSTDGPCFFQMYFYDTCNELQNRLHIMKDANLSESIVRKLMEVLLENPYAQVLRRLADKPLESYEIHIQSIVQLDQRVYNTPSADQVAGIWIEGNNANVPFEREIIIHAHSGKRHRVQHYFGCYDALQYPALFPRGESGWHQNILKKNSHQENGSMHKDTTMPNFASAEDILKNEQEVVTGGEMAKVSCRQYYCYKLQIRDHGQSIILLAGRLLQQFVVDMYIKLETTRLDFYRHKQSQIRAELYQGIVDSVLSGEKRGNMVGKRIVLPASFVGGPRDMRRRYLDAMSLVQHFGKPDLFITMTCNPEWKEIQDELCEGQSPQDRPDLTARIFRAKLQDLKDQLFRRQIFGRVAAHVYVIEFQKRGLPHAHMLIILKPEHKITNSDQYDMFVSAEIPDEAKDPDLYAKVVKHMMHGPCGDLNKKCPCMQNKKCKSHYPRAFCPNTLQGKDSYPIYRRRNDNRKVFVRKASLDNRWVVPYNPYLLRRYNCHLNVEICSGITAVKYLYKYIYKGHDKVSIYIAQGDGNTTIDEIQHFQDARWVSAQEAIWRIFEFDLNEIHPAVINLQVHLPNKQFVSYWKNQDLENLIYSDFASRTMLTEFFSTCYNNIEARKYLYREFPEHYVWEKKGKCWTKRKTREVIGRINGANPAEGERYYLRLLLNHVRGPTSFANLLSYNGVQCSSFKDAAQKRGLLKSDDYISECLHEAANFHMPNALRRLFATILIFCEPVDVLRLWNIHFDSMSEDFAHGQAIVFEERVLKTLKSLDCFLESMGRSIKDFDLPKVDLTVADKSPTEKREILDELAVTIPLEDYSAASSLNSEQKDAYNIIMDCVNSVRSGIFFIDGPGGTGKTYLYRALLATIRLRGMIAIATATSGVAASLLSGGRTAHSRFKIPINGYDSTSCNIPKQSGTAELLRRAKLIIWDEAPMAKRWEIESVDKSLRDIMGNNIIFGGKSVVFGGDFRQVLPVVPRATRAETINSSLVRSYIWPQLQKLKLTKNMRAASDSAFSDFLLRIGNGEEPTTGEEMIKIPSEMLVTIEDNDNPENALISAVYPSIQENFDSAEYITKRAILAPKNETVDMLNEKLIELFPGEAHIYWSYDEAVDDTHNYYPEEFLNTLMPNGLPPHKLVLKKNSPIMLMRNIDPSDGLCNGTRMVCRGFDKDVIDAEITVGQFAGKPVLLPRIPLLPAENESIPFKFKRTQFPIRLCFAMTINKAQGQTIPYVGLYLRTARCFLTWPTICSIISWDFYGNYKSLAQKRS